MESVQQSLKEQKMPSSSRSLLHRFGYTATLLTSLFAQEGNAQVVEPPKQTVLEKKFPPVLVQPKLEFPLPPQVEEILKKIEDLRPDMIHDDFFKREAALGAAVSLVAPMKGYWNSMNFRSHESMYPPDPELRWRRRLALNPVMDTRKPTRFPLESSGTGLAAFEQLSKFSSVEIYIDEDEPGFLARLRESPYDYQKNSFAEIMCSVANVTNTIPQPGKRSAGSICFVPRPKGAVVLTEEKKFLVGSFIPKEAKGKMSGYIISDPHVLFVGTSSSFKDPEQSVAEMNSIIPPEYLTASSHASESDVVPMSVTDHPSGTSVSFQAMRCTSEFVHLTCPVTENRRNATKQIKSMPPPRENYWQLVPGESGVTVQKIRTTPGGLSFQRESSIMRNSSFQLKDEQGNPMETRVVGCTYTVNKGGDTYSIHLQGEGHVSGVVIKTYVPSKVDESLKCEFIIPKNDTK